MAQVIVNGQAATTRGAGRSDTAALKSAYPGSPIHSEAYTDSKAKKIMKDLLGSTVTVPGDGDFDLTFGEAPDLATVAGGGAGLPASPYVPNPSSSPTGLPSDQPAPPDGFGQEASTVGYGDGPTADAADRNPSVTSPKNILKGLTRISS